MGLSFFCTKSLVGNVGDKFEAIARQYLRMDERDGVHVVVLDPANTTAPDVIWERSYGTIPEGKQYTVFAKEKAELSFWIKMSTRDIWLTRPWLLREDDIAYYGGVYHEGICVGISGLVEVRDHDLAREFLAMLMIEISNAAREVDRSKMSAHLGHPA